MSKFGVMVMGPAGAGKSTFCASLITHLNLNRRSCFYVNLDPAAESFEHAPDLDIKDLISLEDVMEEMGLGPNGGLVYCFEFLMENLDFLTEALDGLTEEYLIIFDMPGQIELYTHIPILPALVRFLTTAGALDIRLCAAYLLEATFVVDRAKFFSGTLSAMSAMIMLEIPHVNILSKMDLVKGQVRKKDLKRFLTPDTTLLEDDPTDIARRKAGEQGDDNEDDAADPTKREAVMRGASFRRLNKAVAGLIESFSMVSYLKLDASDEDSVGAILSYIDDCIQYHEAQEPRELKEEEYDEEEE
ncbi:putative transcription factor fet5 protein [Phaeoacremonium minimum UCRPA7]|uniref:GPN-loop GTPase 3 n=1 Tax=Phaeoacremonium minimum (strain UCR-PA7) TaxID=1286976 RepID=R8BVP7_PHAM7|nr:putative transcription factor fet5 protein [Phaeoacremonium minimum UCRPA7]EOO03390.1 putative transcription factor fet5 protein [Phaeoacremonium minimum UCRPA7]